MLSIFVAINAARLPALSHAFLIETLSFAGSRISHFTADNSSKNLIQRDAVGADLVVTAFQLRVGDLDDRTPQRPITFWGRHVAEVGLPVRVIVVEHITDIDALVLELDGEPIIRRSSPLRAYFIKVVVLADRGDRTYVGA